jgi:hypothetical protein
MKTYTKVVAGLLLASATALGQSNQVGSPERVAYFASLSSHSEAYIQRATDNYVRLLNSANDGVLESAIAHLTYMRMGSTECNLGQARAIINKLSESGRTPVIRYKAYLSTIVFQSPELFAEGVRASSSEGNEFFLEIASKVQKTLLGHNM